MSLPSFGPAHFPSFSTGSVSLLQGRIPSTVHQPISLDLYRRSDRDTPERGYSRIEAGTGAGKSQLRGPLALICFQSDAPDCP